MLVSQLVTWTCGAAHVNEASYIKRRTDKPISYKVLEMLRLTGSQLDYMFGAKTR